MQEKKEHSFFLQGVLCLAGIFSFATFAALKKFQTFKVFGRQQALDEILNNKQFIPDQREAAENKLESDNFVTVIVNGQMVDVDFNLKHDDKNHEQNKVDQLKTISEIPNLTLSVKKQTQNLIEIQRAVDLNYKFYIREKINKDELQKNYQIKHLKTKKDLANHCDAMIPVRGDGNCFYTSFGYQFLKFLINDQKYFKEIKQKYFNIEMKIIKDGQTIFENDEKQTYQKLLQNFFDRIDYFSQIEDQKEREQQFEKSFAAFEENEKTDGFFNTLTVVFLRNLSYLLVEQSGFKDAVFDKQNLLIWEKECNNNEVVITLLAENLNLKIKLLFFDEQDFKLLEYNPEFKYRTVILLIKPGHYNIGIKY